MNAQLNPPEELCSDADVAARTGRPRSGTVELCAAPEPIAGAAVSSPIYDNANLMWRSAWIHDNHEKLKSYWESLPGEGSDEDWDAFTWTQWDRQMTRRDENRSTLRQY